MSITKIDTAHVCHTVIYDSLPKKYIRGFHVRKEYDFDILVDFKDTVKLTGFNYTASGSRFLIHYGESGIVSVPDHSQKSKHSFSVYPNPASGSLFVSGKDLKDIKIYNALGQICFSRKATSERQEIDLEEFNPGVYFIRINNSELRKIIVR
jgi:hypothetical protein